MVDQRAIFYSPLSYEGITLCMMNISDKSTRHSNSSYFFLFEKMRTLLSLSVNNYVNEYPILKLEVKKTKRV